jgi:hypothetical protein
MQIHLSGERVAPGVYRQIDGSRKLFLEDEDCLPESADGVPARYERVESQETPRTTAYSFALAGIGARS